MMEAKLQTPLTQALGIRHPVFLAGMNVSGAELAAAVSNAGGLGVIGGVALTPKMLRKEIAELKAKLASPNLPFGVDLLLPQIGGNARKTNSDYTGGHLSELVDIIIEEKAKLFVSAVGVPPKWVVDKLHAAGILVQNMIGHPKHAIKAMEVGVDIVCAQGTEGGGHTGGVASMVLWPAVLDTVKGHKSPMLKSQVAVVAAGGIYDGRGLATALQMGCQAVWVGTRFVASLESKAPPRHVQAVVDADYDETIRSTLWTGRPLRARTSGQAVEWETLRKKEMLELEAKGIVAITTEFEKLQKDGNPAAYAQMMPLLMGQAAGGVKDVKPAKDIVDSMVSEAADIIKRSSGVLVGGGARPAAARL